MTGALEVERGQEQARRPRQTPGMAIYPFGLMKVGDAFQIGDHGIVGRVRGAAAAYGKRHGMKFSVTYEMAGSEKVYRCWRVK